jgi:protein O-mannosyl-transferase
MTNAPRFSRWIPWAIVLVTLAVYWPVTTFQFLSYDDPDFVTANSHVQAGLTANGFLWAWHSEVARNWHPVTMLSHMLDCQLFGLNPGGPHLVNLLWHAANAVLLFYLLQRMTGALWRSALVAALFAWHPLHVESVAWVAERKDVLSTFFWFAATFAYVRYAEQSASAGPRRGLFYGLALLLFAVGLLCKPMLVTLPFTLLLLDYWPLKRWTFPTREKPKAKSRALPARASPSLLLLEKIPFLVLSAALCVITYSVQQRGGAVLGVNNLSVHSRADNALLSYVRYLGKMFWPQNLAALYLRAGDWPPWEVAAAALGLLAVSALVVAQLRPRPYLAVGWFWYLGTLVPVIGLVQAGMQSMADRYTYIPFVGIFLIVSWGGAELAQAGRRPVFAFAAALVALTACLAVTSRQLTFWKDSETFYQRMIDVMPGNYMAHYNLGNLYSLEQRTNDAFAQFSDALDAEPNYADAHNNLGGLLLASKRYDDALAHYRTALRLDPNFIRYFNLANALADAASARHDTNEFAQAVQTYRQALQLNPASSQAHHNLGLTWQAQGRDPEAVSEFQDAVRLDPTFEDAQLSLAAALSRAGQFDQAAAHYRAVTQLEPDRFDAWNSLALSCAMANKMEDAAAAFRQVIRLRPADPAAYGNLGNALASQNKIDDAIPAYLTALKLNPDNCQTEFNLALSLSREGKIAQADAHYQQALRINPNYAEAKRALLDLRAREGK